MKTLTKVLASVVAIIGLIGPAIAPALQNLIAAHPAVAAALAAVSTILALFHNPTKAA
jgi:hypothetical protein